MRKLRRVFLSRRYAVFFAGATINETAKFYRSMYKNFDNALFHRLLEIFPLDYKAKIAAMSKGMQRQAALITAVAASPRYFYCLTRRSTGLTQLFAKPLKEYL